MRINRIWVHCIMITFLLPSVSWTQEVKRTNIWYFGYNAGLDFNTFPPSVLKDGQLNSMEGCATICDTAGQLLLYTDGSTAWNKHHRIIPGGTQLGGNYSSTQSSIVIPKPLHPEQLYIFSLDAIHMTRELKYSVVDITQNDSEGAFIEKKVKLLEKASEKLTAVKHCNQIDYWIIAHGFNTSSFYVWLLTSDGIDPIPLITNIGSNNGPKENEGIGYMKASPKGDRLALGLYGKDIIELFDFNNQTGEISRPLTLTGPDIMLPYGIEFSPQGKYLYFSGFKKKISQIDITLETVDQMVSSLTVIAEEDFNWNLSALQLGPDGKMYISKMNRPHLAVIHEPDAKGKLCRFEDQYISLDPVMSTIGLPNYIPSFLQYNPIVSVERSIDSCQHSAMLRAKVSGLPNDLLFEWYVNNTMILKGQKDSLCVYSSGDYMVKVSSMNACGASRLESVFSFRLDLSGSYSSDTITSSICEGEMYEGYGVSGIYRDTFKTSYGCDSIRILDLFVRPKIINKIEVDVCAGQSYDGYSESGEYTDVFQLANGCDSVRILHLTVLPVKTSQTCISICEGESFEGYHHSGQYSDIFTSVQGCDSIRILHLSVVPNKHSTIEATICASETFEGYTITGIFSDHFISYDGCDSIRTIHLTVLPKIQTEYEVYLCKGEVYEGHSISGLYTDFFKAQNGCDSIRTLRLNIRPKVQSNLEISLCEGEVFEGYNQSGQYMDVFTDRHGCDSIRHLNLTVHPAKKTEKHTTICEGQLYESYKEAGSYSDVFTTIYGCDSVRTLHLSVLPRSFSHTKHIVCPDSIPVFNGIKINSSGFYYDTITNVSGCDSIISAEFIMTKNPKFLGDNQKICHGHEYILRSGEKNVIWFDEDESPEKSIRQTGLYWAGYPDENGCVMKDSVYIEFARIIDFPNIFSPNGDYINDCFKPVFDENEFIESFRIHIYDRWSNRVYMSDDKEDCWNGESSFQPCSEGVYIYVAEIVSTTCGKITMTGDVTLVR